MQPPWIEFPTIPLGSIGWRMGAGEEYWARFDKWFRQLQPSQRQRFTGEHPEPDGWVGFYARKEAYIQSMASD